MRKRTRLNWKNIFILLFAIWVITAPIVIAVRAQKQINDIWTKINATESENAFVEHQSPPPEQTFAHEPKNAFKNDVEIIAEEVGIEFELLEAIIRHETSNRTSRAFKDLNNPCGMMYWTGKKMALRKYSSIDKGYYACAINLKNNYIDKGLDTIMKIQKKYAPIGTNDKGNVNQYWANGVTNIYKKLKGGN